ncbi:unnamed protein product [Prunus armeniaca]
MMMKEEVQLAQEEKNFKECMKCHTHAKRRKGKKYGMEANKKKLNSHACECHPLQRSSNSMSIHRQDEVGVRYCIKIGMVVLESIMMFLLLSPINREVFKLQNTHQTHNLLLSSLSFLQFF